MSIARYLTGSRLFSLLPADERLRIAALSAERRYAKGEVLFSEGEPAASVWLVQQGWVRLVTRAPSGRRHTMFILTADEVLCGISAFDDAPYSADAVAATAVRVVVLPAALFRDLLTRYPAFAHRVLLIACDRIRHMAAAYSGAFEPAGDRLIRVLLRLHRQFGRHLPVTHRELAAMAGTTVETSIRTLSRFRRQGIVDGQRGEIHLLNTGPLRAMTRPVASQRGVVLPMRRPDSLGRSPRSAPR